MIRYVILVLSLLSTAVHAQLYQWKPISVEEAKQIVRQIEGDPNAAVKLVRAPKLDSAEPHRFCELMSRYELVSGHNRYRIGAFDQTVSFEDESFTRPSEGAARRHTGAAIISESQARAIAVGFLLKHYPSPSLVYGKRNLPRVRTPQPNSSQDTNYCYFRQQTGKGVTGPSRCSISVDPASGRVVSYDACSWPLLVPLSPTLSAREAAASAVTALGMKDAHLLPTGRLSVGPLDSMGMERLCYRLEVYARPPWPFRGYSFWSETMDDPLSWSPCDGCVWGIVVDAHDGSPLDLGLEPKMYDDAGAVDITPQHTRAYSPIRAMRGNSRIAFRCLSIHGRPFVPAEYLCYGDPTARLARANSNSFAIEGKKRHVRLRLNSRDCAVDGRSMRLPARPEMLHGTLYVHVSALRGIVPFRFGYQWWRQTLWLGTPPDVSWTSWMIFLAGTGIVALAFILVCRIRKGRRLRRV